MKKIKMLYIVILMSSGLAAQVQLYKTSLAPAGGGASTASNKMIYTSGEIFISENTNAGIHLSEGFISPDMIRNMHIENFNTLKGVVLYPNPVRDNLHIRFPENKSYEIYLYDLTGKELIHKKTEGKQTELNLHGFHSGNYLLVVIDRETKSYASLKVRKL